MGRTFPMPEGWPIQSLHPPRGSVPAQYYPWGSQGLASDLRDSEAGVPRAFGAGPGKRWGVGYSFRADWEKTMKYYDSVLLPLGFKMYAVDIPNVIRMYESPDRLMLVEISYDQRLSSYGLEVLVRETPPGNP
jgi:hypothetical protein